MRSVERPFMAYTVYIMIQPVHKILNFPPWGLTAQVNGLEWHKAEGLMARRRLKERPESIRDLTLEAQGIGSVASKAT